MAEMSKGLTKVSLVASRVAFLTQNRRKLDHGRLCFGVGYCWVVATTDDENALQCIDAL